MKRGKPMERILCQMADLVNQKYLHIKDYCNLTREQKSLLEQGDIEALGGNIGSKQAIIDQVNQIDARLRQLQNMLKEDFGVVALEGLPNHHVVKAILEVKGRIKEIISQAIELDKENTGNLRLFLERIGTEMENNQKSARALKAYHHGNPEKQAVTVPVFMDHKR
jgi:hypothetical protein